MPAAIALASLFLGAAPPNAVPLTPRKTEVPPPADADVPEADPEPTDEPDAEGDSPPPPEPEPEASTLQPPPPGPDPFASPESTAPAEPTPTPTDTETPPFLEPEVTPKSHVEASHRRLFLRFGAGIGHCAQFDCEVVPIAGTGALEAGWKAKYVAFGLDVFGGGGRGKAPNFDTTDTARGELTFLFIGPKFALHPAAIGIVDPHLDLGIGWSRVTSEYDVLGSLTPRTNLKLSRGAVLFGGGLDVFASEMIAVGPNFSYQLPFAGKGCFEEEGAMEVCATVDEILDGEEGANARALRRSFPHIWTLTLSVRLALGPSMGGA